MSNKILEPSDSEDISCHLQQTGMGSLICRAVRQVGEHTTNETTPTICLGCDAGKIYREVGCDAVTPKIRIFSHGDDRSSLYIENLFCSIRKRFTDLENCRKCNLVSAETTKKIVSETRGLFKAQGFYSAYKDIEKAREAIRDGNFDYAITRSISCLESTMKICHDKLNETLPKKKQLPDLWKSTRNILKFDDIDTTLSTINLLNSLTGVIMHISGLRNALSDAHGKGVISLEVSESIAELSINTASTISTIIVRRYNQIKEEENERGKN